MPRLQDIEAIEALVARAPGDAVRLDTGQTLVHTEALTWLRALPDNVLHGVVTDPPYGLVEYEDAHHDKLRKGRGGVWRIPPTLDGVKRSPVPRFTVLKPADIGRLEAFFEALAVELRRVLVPGAHVFVASNPLVAGWTFAAFQRAGLDNRGTVVRLVQTLRGGDRPKGAHVEFRDVTVMPRSAWEPWGVFRVPLDGTVANTLRTWGTGGLRRRGPDEPFKDVIKCAPTHAKERALSRHPSLKPQRFVRQLVRAALPLEKGIVLDPFGGGGSTLAAAAATDTACISLERDAGYVAIARDGFEALRSLDV